MDADDDDDGRWWHRSLLLGIFFYLFELQRQNLRTNFLKANNKSHQTWMLMYVHLGFSFSLFKVEIKAENKLNWTLL